MSEKERVLRTVEGILMNKPTPENIEALLHQLLNAGIDSADILKGVVSLVYDKAVSEPTLCPLYTQMCIHLSKALPEFPSDQDGGKHVTFRRILLNICQEEFEGADNMRAEIRQMTKPEQEVERIEKLVKLRTLGNLRLIGELVNQKMITDKIVHHCILMLLGRDSKDPTAEVNVEALCLLLATAGKRLDRSSKSVRLMNHYFSQLKELGRSSQLPPHIRFMIRDTISLRANMWVPCREEVKAKTINEIHAKAEQKHGPHHGVMGLRNGRGMPSYIPPMDSEGWETFSVSRMKSAREGLRPLPNIMPVQRLGGVSNQVKRPNSTSSRLLPQGSAGSFMGRPSAFLINSAPKPANASFHPNVGVLETGQYGTAPGNLIGFPEKETGAVSSMSVPSASVTPAVLQKKTESLLKEYLSVADLMEALICVEELQSPEYYPELVQMAVSMGLERERESVLIRKFLEELSSNQVLSARDVTAGVILVAEQLEDLALDVPFAPKHLGGLVGKLLLSGVVELDLLSDIIQKAEDPMLKKGVYDAALSAIKSGPNSERVLSKHSELQECEKLVALAAK